MKTSKTGKKLALNKTTLRTLSNDELGQVGGGALQNAVQSEFRPPISWSCQGFQLSL